MKLIVDNSGPFNTDRVDGPITLRRPAPAFNQQLADWMALYRQMKAQGAADDEVAALMIPALREIWPKGREEPWHYLCERCNDTGQMREDYDHPTFGTIRAVGPCYCAKGVAYRAARTHADQQKATGRKKGWSHVADD